MLSRFINDINAVLFAIIGIVFFMPLCTLLSLGVYFLRITEEGWRGAFTPWYTRLFVEQSFFLTGFIVFAFCMAVVIVGMSFAAAFRYREVPDPDYAPKINYQLTAGSDPRLPLGDDEMSWVPDLSYDDVIDARTRAE